MSEAQDTFNV